MSKNIQFDERYKSGDTPWDGGKPDFHLIDIVTNRPISKCKVLDIGCGTGTDTIWLSHNGFLVTGIDVSETAIKKARKKATKESVECVFEVKDFINQKIPGAPFGFAFDRGCFHSFDTGNIRKKYAENVSRHLDKKGLWLSIIGSADDSPRDQGPPMLTAKDIVTVVEPFFKILSLSTSHFDSNHPRMPKAWVCLMQKRSWKQV